MPICRIMKENNYTCISNHYLRDTSLSLDAKGLLTLMLSLPEDWDYTIAGLTNFTSDGRVCVANTIHELEEHGYIKRRQNRGENGAFSQNEYWIYEMPQTEDLLYAEKAEPEAAASENADTEDIEPMADNETADMSVTETGLTSDEAQQSETVFTENTTGYCPMPCPNLPLPLIEKPLTASMPAENLAQQIKELQKTEKQNLIRYDLMRARAEKRVEYAVLRQEFSTELLDELVSLIVEMEMCESPEMRIAGGVYPQSIVRARMLALNAECIRYVLDCLHEVKPQIKNIKKYLMAALFNAPATLENCIDTRVRQALFADSALASAGR